MEQIHILFQKYIAAFFNDCSCNIHPKVYCPPSWKSSGIACIAIKHKCLFSDCEEREKLVSPKFDSAQNIELKIGVQSSPDSPLLLGLKHYTIQPCIISSMLVNHV